MLRLLAQLVELLLRHLAGAQQILYHGLGIFPSHLLFELLKLLKGLPAHVNMIPLNHVEESPLKPSRRTRAFQQRLESHGVTATVRRSLGGDIDASCGQLRRKEMESKRKAEAKE